MSTVRLSIDHADRAPARAGQPNWNLHMFPEPSEQPAHFVRFYDDDALLLAEVAEFIDGALRGGGVGIIIAAAGHINDLRRRLVGFGSAQHPGTWFPGKLVILDADDTLAQFMVDGWPDESRFDEVVGTVVREACASGQTVNAFGEMVALLCERGLHEAAIRLEQLWNGLAARASFSLFCGYPWHLFPSAESAEAFRRVCAEHDHACASGHRPSPTEPVTLHARLVELEQQSRALKAEVARRVAVEHTLKLREKEFSDFVENAAEGLHRVAADGTILWANKAELAMLGYRWEEYVGRHIAEFHVDRPVIETILQKIASGETLYDHPARLRCRDGRIKHVLIHSNGFFEGGELRYTRCFTRDATERHERDQALAQRDRMLLHAPVAAALLTGADLTFRLANRRFSELAGRTQLEGATFADAFPELSGSELARLIEQVRTTGEPFSGGEIPFVVRANDRPVQERFVRISLEPLESTEGQARSIILVAVDVTEHVHNRKVLEQANLERSVLLARLAEANSAKDAFLAMLGHELRNPLSPIVMALELMRLRGDNSTAKEQQIIRRQVDHMVRLVDDLLDVSRITRGRIHLQISDVDISQVLAKAIEMASPLLEQRAHKLDVELAEGLRMEGDAVRLAQVFSNLLTNAARYTDNGGKILMSGSREGDETLRISVSDNGTGISEEALPRVFELFFQGERTMDGAKGGLGIGLSLVRNIVELHGGTVEARSRGPGCGSEFVVTLPVRCRSGKTTVPSAMQASAAPAVVHRRIMLVDDNVDAVNTLGTLLELAGHHVRIFNDPVVALAAVDGFSPDIAILDIGLPVISGYELAERIRSILGDRPCQLIALTGYGQEADKVRSRAAGFEQHFVKPIDPEHVVRLVNGPRISHAQLPGDRP
jgi:PAS domain S-box-containing protein